jgi:hypothetical protein
LGLDIIPSCIIDIFAGTRHLWLQISMIHGNDAIAEKYLPARLTIRRGGVLSVPAAISNWGTEYRISISIENCCCQLQSS